MDSRFGNLDHSFLAEAGCRSARSILPQTVTSFRRHVALGQPPWRLQSAAPSGQRATDSVIGEQAYGFNVSSVNFCKNWPLILKNGPFGFSHPAFPSAQNQYILSNIEFVRMYPVGLLPLNTFTSRSPTTTTPANDLFWFF